MTNIKLEKGEEDAPSKLVNVSCQGSASLNSPTIKTESSSRQPVKTPPGNFQSANQPPPNYAQANARRARCPSNPPPQPRLQSPFHFSSQPEPSNPYCHSLNPEEQTYLVLWQHRGLQKESIISSFETTFQKRVEQRYVKRTLTRLEKHEEETDQLLSQAPSYAWWTPETEVQRIAGEKWKTQAAARRRLKEGKVRATLPFTEEVSVDPSPIPQIKPTAPIPAASSKTSTAPPPALRPLNIPPPPRAPRLAPVLAEAGLPSPSHHRRPRHAPRTPPLSPLPKAKPAAATMPITPGSTPGAVISIDSDEDDDDGELNPDEKFYLTGCTATPFFATPTSFFATPRLPPPNHRFTGQTSTSDLLQIPAGSQQSHYGASPITPNYIVNPSRHVSMSPLTLDSPFEFPNQRSSTGRVLSSGAQFPRYPPPDFMSPPSLRRPSQPVRPTGSPQDRGNMYSYPPMEDMDQVAARARTARSVGICRVAPRAYLPDLQANSYLYPAPASSPPPRPHQISHPTGLPQPRLTNATGQPHHAPMYPQTRNHNPRQRARGDAHRSFSPGKMEEERMEQDEKARHTKPLRGGWIEPLRTGRRML